MSDCILLLSGGLVGVVIGFLAAVIMRRDRYDRTFWEGEDDW